MSIGKYFLFGTVLQRKQKCYRSCTSLVSFFFADIELMDMLYDPKPLRLDVNASGYSILLSSAYILKSLFFFFQIERNSVNNTKIVPVYVSDKSFYEHIR